MLYLSQVGVSLGLAAIAISVVACGSSAEGEATGSAQQEQISDIGSMTQRPDGQFDVVCKNGATEVVTATQIAQNQVCRGGSTGGGGSANRVILYGSKDSCDSSRVDHAVDRLQHAE